MRKESKVREAEQRLRKLVNIPLVQDRLMKNARHWQQLCSSMDVIGDTDLAVDAFLNSQVGERDYGMLYLHVYGLLQVLFVQQDAVEHAAEAIGMPYTADESLGTIRKIRHDVVGHPTKRGGTQSFGIIRVSLSLQSFRMFSFDLSRADNFRTVHLLEVIREQLAAVADAIEKMIAYLCGWPEVSGTPAIDL